MTSNAGAQPHGADRPIAILPWGDVIEDFLDDIGMTTEEFAAKMTGGWLFGYVAALQRRGVGSVIICMSRRATEPIRTRHEPTGAAMVFLPASAAYRSLRRRMTNPYGGSMRAMFGARPAPTRLFWRAARHVAPYLATPPFALAREIRRAQCRGILCQEYESPRFDAAVLAAAWLRVPVFATFQGGTRHRSRLERFVRRHTLARTSGVIAASALEAERIRTRYGVPDAKIARIFNPINLSDWPLVSREAARSRLGIPPTARVAIWHGRVDVHVKGLDVLLDAWRRVCAARPAREGLLLLVGDGADADALAREIERTHTPNLRWIRRYVTDRRCINDCLHAANVYVLSSRREGFPVAPLEAMACALPVVASSVAGASEIFGHTAAFGGLVVPCGDAAAFAAALETVLDDDALEQRLGERARARVETAFGLEAVGAQLAQLIGGRA